MESLEVNDNQLMGTLPASLKNWKNATSLSFQNNFFSGSVPNEIGALAVDGSLTGINLMVSGVTGTLPMDLCQIDENQLDFSCLEELCGCSCDCSTFPV
jgi:hypothetical protein